MSEFTGYLISQERRDNLLKHAIDYDFNEFVCHGEIPATRGIKDLMAKNKIREDQYNMNSCSGFGGAHAVAVVFYLQSGKWRSFNPLWTYRRGQEIAGIRGDNGGTIDGVVEGLKKSGALPEDIENDGKKEFPYEVNYNYPFPPKCVDIAKERQVGYSAYLTSFKAILNFIQGGQGAVIIGGPWGNWSPGKGGICRNFRGGGGGHARAYVDWIKIDDEVFLVEANSHFLQYGDQGFAYHSQQFVDAQCNDSSFVAIGISDMTLAKGDKPRLRIPHFVTVT